MSRAKKGAKLRRELPAAFVRGAVVTGILAALQDQRRGGDLLRSTLLGGAALSTAVTVEELLFNKELKLGKKKNGKNKGGIDLNKLQALLTRGRPTGLAALGSGQQFLTGALLGAAVVYLLGDEALRAKLIRAGVQIYAGLAGNLEEIKEQIADAQAELAAEQRGA